MPGKRVLFNIDDAIKMYESGELPEDIAAVLGGSRKTVTRRLHRAGVSIRPSGVALKLIAARQVDGVAIAAKYDAGRDIKSLCAEFGIGRRRVETVIKMNGGTLRTLRQAVGLRYARMSKSERQSLVAHAHIAKKGVPASIQSLERRAKTMEVTLQLASRADLILGVWLAQRGVQFTPQKALGPYNLDIAIDELSVAVEVNGDWHYFPDRTAAESKRRDFLLDRGWSVIDVRLAATSARPWKYLRPTCADKIVAVLNQIRREISSGSKHWVVGGDGEPLTGFGGERDDWTAIRRPIA
jgi:very-short-patch-repair endonuclease